MPPKEISLFAFALSAAETKSYEKRMTLSFCEQNENGVDGRGRAMPKREVTR